MDETRLVVEETAGLRRGGQFLALLIVLHVRAPIVGHMPLADAVRRLKMLVVVGSDGLQRDAGQIPGDLHQTAVRRVQDTLFVVIPDIAAEIVLVGVGVGVREIVACVLVLYCVRRAREPVGDVGGLAVGIEVGLLHFLDQAIDELDPIRLCRAADQHIEVVRGGVQQLKAPEAAIRVVPAVASFVPVPLVVVGPVLLIAIKSCAPGQEVVDHGTSGRRLGDDGISLTQDERGVVLGRERGGVVDARDRAHGGIQTAGGPLRSARHRDGGHVDIVKFGGDLERCQGHTVDGRAQTRVDGSAAARAHAADGEAAGHRIAEIPLHVANTMQHLRHVQRIQRLELRAGHDGDRLRHILLGLQCLDSSLLLQAAAHHQLIEVAPGAGGCAGVGRVARGRVAQRGPVRVRGTQCNVLGRSCTERAQQ